MSRTDELIYRDLLAAHRAGALREDMLRSALRTADDPQALAARVVEDGLEAPERTEADRRVTEIVLPE